MKVQAQIVGHTIVAGIRVQGRLIQIDAGMVRFDRWAAIGINADGLWALREDFDSTLIRPNHDVFLPILSNSRLEEADPAPAEEPHYSRGDVVWLFGSEDGRHARYFLVVRTVAQRHRHMYLGYDLEVTPSGWEANTVGYPADFVDDTGRSALDGPLTSDQLRQAFSE